MEKQDDISYSFNPVDSNSIIDRDEEENIKYFGSIVNNERSLTGIYPSQSMSIDFMPESDSLFTGLQVNNNGSLLTEVHKNLNPTNETNVTSDVFPNLKNIPKLAEIEGIITNLDRTVISPSHVPTDLVLQKIIKNRQSLNSTEISTPFTCSVLNRKEINHRRSYGHREDSRRFMHENNNLFNSSEDEINNTSSISQEIQSANRSNIDNLFYKRRLPTNGSQVPRLYSGLPPIITDQELIELIRKKRDQERCVRNPKTIKTTLSMIHDNECIKELNPRLYALRSDSINKSTTFKIHSSDRALHWPAIELGKKMKQTCLIQLKTDSNCFEKVYFTFSNVDSQNENSFEFYYDDCWTNEFNITLRPNQYFELIVRFIASQVGQTTWNVVFKISNQKMKQFLPLYAYGGRSLMSANLTYCPAYHKPYMLIDAATMTTKVSLVNLGSDYMYYAVDACYKYSSAIDDNILSCEGLLSPHFVKEIKLELKRIRFIKRTVFNSDEELVPIGHINMYYGDESSRNRLGRMILANKQQYPYLFSHEQHIIKRIMKLAVTPAKPDIRLLDDSPYDIYTRLFEACINYCTIDIVAIKSKFR